VCVKFCKTVISTLAYLLDDVGSRTKLTLSNGDVIAYGYDDTYQLTSELRKDSQSQTLYDIAFHYDANGNRTKKVKDGTTTTYTYDEGDKLTKETTGATNTTYTYDGNGSLTKKTDGTNTDTYGYDVFGMMASFSDGTNSATYQYFGKSNSLVGSVPHHCARGRAGDQEESS